MSLAVARRRPAVQRPVTWSVLAVVLIKVVTAFVMLLVAVMLYIWGMRKVIADMQNRIGPNRAGPYGVLQTLADGIKLFFKEQSIPTTADRPVFRLAPYLSIMPAFLMFCIVPDRRHGLDPRSRRPTCRSRTCRSARCASSRCRGSVCTA